MGSVQYCTKDIAQEKELTETKGASKWELILLPEEAFYHVDGTEVLLSEVAPGNI